MSVINFFARPLIVLIKGGGLLPAPSPYCSSPARPPCVTRVKSNAC